LNIKTDENIGSLGIEFLRARGHDVETVLAEGLSGASDLAVYSACAT
jgi:hypothetical protein